MKKLNLNIKTILIFTSIFLVSCEFLSIEDKRAHEIEDLLDYKLHDIIKFTNGLDTLNFKIVNLERKINYNGNLKQIEYVTNQQKNYIISEKNNADDSYIDVLRIGITGHINQIPYRENLIISLEEKVSHKFENSIVEYYEGYNFKGNIYKDVYEVLLDTTNNFKPKVPYILRAIPGGILKFYDSETKEMWQRVK